MLILNFIYSIIKSLRKYKYSLLLIVWTLLINHPLKSIGPIMVNNLMVILAIVELFLLLIKKYQLISSHIIKYWSSMINYFHYLKRIFQNISKIMLNLLDINSKVLFYVLIMLILIYIADLPFFINKYVYLSYFMLFLLSITILTNSSKTSRKHILQHIMTPPSKWLLLYFGWAICSYYISFLFSTNHSGLRILMYSIKLMPSAIIIYFAINMLTTTKSRLKILATAWIINGLVGVALGFMQFSFSSPYPKSFGYHAVNAIAIKAPYADFPIVIGFFGHPNPFAQVLMIFVIILNTASHGIN